MLSQFRHFHLILESLLIQKECSLPRGKHANELFIEDFKKSWIQPYENMNHELKYTLIYISL